MSVPAGFGEGGMPVGLQLIGNYFRKAAAARRARAAAGDRLAPAAPAGRAPSRRRL
jgi:Asp-tRNA(Asn)/Glu-tRNA(Gln) amidotransferase A subunit family amidase